MGRAHRATGIPSSGGRTNPIASCHPRIPRCRKRSPEGASPQNTSCVSRRNMNHVLSPARLVPCSAGKGSIIPISALGENSVTRVPYRDCLLVNVVENRKKSTQWPKRSPGCSERTGGFLKNSSRQKASSRFKKISEILGTSQSSGDGQN